MVKSIIGWDSNHGGPAGIKTVDDYKSKGMILLSYSTLKNYLLLVYQGRSDRIVEKWFAVN